MKNIIAVLICLFTVSQAFANETSRPEKVGALARLEPHQGIYELAGPSFVVPATISKMLVKEGQMLNKGDVVAVLDMADVRRIEAAIARAEVEQARVNIAGKRREFNRRQILFRNMSVSQESLDAARDSYKLAQIALEKARLNYKRAMELVNKMIIRSPINGRVLKIYARAGEAVPTTTGIVEIGDVDNMEAVAEVYETDIKYVREGQAAIFRSPALSKPLQGTVSRIAPRLTRVAIYSSNPMPHTESRIVKVFITLKDSATASRFINLQGTVLIDTSHKGN